MNSTLFGDSTDMGLSRGELRAADAFTPAAESGILLEAACPFAH
jgi:hypothetical protein